LRIVAQTAGGGSYIVVSGEGEPGPFTPVRRYDAERDWLSDEQWFGSFVKFLGGYLDEPDLDVGEQERILARVSELWV
jgi:hypothetical protein